MGFRPNRLAEEIKREVTSMLQTDLKDPRICRFSSITDVEVSRDLRYAKLFVSIYGSEEEQAQTLAGLQSAGGFIRSELGKRIRLRFFPELTFCLDTSIQKGVKLTNLIRQVIDDQRRLEIEADRLSRERIFFKTAGSFIITSHSHPDGDAIGSVIGLGLALRDLDKDVAIILEEPLPDSYRFLPGSGIVLAGGRSVVDLPRFACGIVLDCTSLERVGKEVAKILERCESLINIDHHISNTRFGAVNVVDAEASATGEILYLLMSGLDIRISPEVATNLYTAIVTDTGFFQFQNTTSRCHLTASMLLELGADHRQVQQLSQ